MNLNTTLIQEMVDAGRNVSVPEFDDPTLGPLRMFPGTWRNTEELKGYGFNMMALPLLPDADENQDPTKNGFKLLMNQYDEELNFSVVDKGVPNRGSITDPVTQTPDQTIVALNYFQLIKQINSDDFRKTDLHQKFDGDPIHKEPGLWLYMTNHQTTDINIARLGSIPHGNSFLAAGRVRNRKANDEDEDIFALENPDVNLLQRIIPNINGVVVGGGENPEEIDLDPIVNPATGEVIIDYFSPYRHYHQNPFKGTQDIPGFKGFDPVNSTDLLRHALMNVILSIGTIKRVMRLHVDSTLDHSGVNRFNHNGIINIPFVVRQADATAMNSTFLIYEVEDSNTGKTRHFLQYAQNVILDFIGRPDGHPGRARWPHVSINTMERVADPAPEAMMRGLM